MRISLEGQKYLLKIEDNTHTIKLKSGKRGHIWSTQIFSILYFILSLYCKYKSKFKKLGNMAIQYFRANFWRRNKLCDIKHHRNPTAYLNYIYSMYIRWSRMDMCIISGIEHEHEMISPYIFISIHLTTIFWIN